MGNKKNKKKKRRNWRTETAKNMNKILEWRKAARSWKPPETPGWQWDQPDPTDGAANRLTVFSGGGDDGDYKTNGDDGGDNDDDYKTHGIDGGDNDDDYKTHGIDGGDNDDDYKTHGIDGGDNDDGNDGDYKTNGDQQRHPVMTRELSINWNVMSSWYTNPVRLIEEVKKRPQLYSGEHTCDRAEKLELWKEIGAELIHDWDTYNKATVYDRVLQLQKKWRSLRDAYNRELRSRKSGVRVNRRVYIYFKKMSFLGGYEGNISDENDSDTQVEYTHDQDGDPLVWGEIKTTKMSKVKREKPRNSSSDEPSPLPEEVEVPMFPMEMAEENETDSDRLFLLSFATELKQLPLNIKMWARAQIANVMQEAVNSQYSGGQPGAADGHAAKLRKVDPE